MHETLNELILIAPLLYPLIISLLLSYLIFVVITKRSQFNKFALKYKSIEQEVIDMQKKFAKEQLEMNQVFLKNISENSRLEFIEMQQKINKINKMLNKTHELIIDKNKLETILKEKNAIIERKSKQIQRLKK